VAVLIDHCAEDALEKADGAYVAVTVGDDTTAIAGDILARLGIPIIGVTDGDLDRLAGDTMIHPGSIIIKVTPGCDDIIGKSIKIEIFKGEIKSSLVADEIFERILKLAGQHIISVERF
jgi:hypothetical protein